MLKLDVHWEFKMYLLLNAGTANADHSRKTTTTKTKHSHGRYKYLKSVQKEKRHVTYRTVQSVGGEGEGVRD